MQTAFEKFSPVDTWKLLTPVDAWLTSRLRRPIVRAHYEGWMHCICDGPHVETQVVRRSTRVCGDSGGWLPKVTASKPKINKLFARLKKHEGRGPANLTLCLTTCGSPGPAAGIYAAIAASSPRTSRCSTLHLVHKTRRSCHVRIGSERDSASFDPGLAKSTPQQIHRLTPNVRASYLECASRLFLPGRDVGRDFLPSQRQAGICS